MSEGRTLFQILKDRFSEEEPLLEMQVHNPLQAKVGACITIDEPEFQDVNFFVERIAVYETEIGPKTFFHTDYCLKAAALGQDKPLRMRLRLIDDEDEMNELGCSIQLLHLYDEFGYEEDFYHYCCSNGCSDSRYDEGEWVDHEDEGEEQCWEGEFTFKVEQDDEGNQLEEPRIYWRVGEAEEPYEARQTTLTDLDGDGKIDEDELERRDVEYFDFSRITENADSVEITENLWIEMDVETRFFTLFRGTEVIPSQVMVI